MSKQNQVNIRCNRNNPFKIDSMKKAVILLFFISFSIVLLLSLEVRLNMPQKK